MSNEELKHIKHIFRWILQYDKIKRPTASELLNDPWFSEPANSHPEHNAVEEEPGSENDVLLDGPVAVATFYKIMRWLRMMFC